MTKSYLYTYMSKENCVLHKIFLSKKQYYEHLNNQGCTTHPCVETDLIINNKIKITPLYIYYVYVRCEYNSCNGTILGFSISDPDLNQILDHNNICIINNSTHESINKIDNFQTELVSFTRTLCEKVLVALPIENSALAQRIALIKFKYYYKLYTEAIKEDDIDRKVFEKIKETIL